MTKQIEKYVILILGSFILPLIGYAQDFDFITSQEIRTDLGPVFTLTEDFDKDGNMDLAVGHDSSTILSILLGNGSGIFTLADNYSADAHSITAGDFNEDGRVDLVGAGQFASTISILLGNSDGTFNVSGAMFIPGAGGGGIAFRSIKSGDFNKDGHQDLLAAGFRQYSAVILFGDGNGNFSQPEYVIASVTGVPRPVRLSGLSAVEINDFNEDTNLDLAVLNRDESRIFLFFGDGSGTFSSPFNLEAGVNPRSLSMKDINKDGHIDIIVAGSGVGSPVVLLGNGLGNFISKVSFGLGTEEWTDAIADFNQDGNLDIAAPDFLTGNMDLGAGDGSGQFTFKESFIVGGAPRGATSGDFNNDGFPDLAVANPASGINKISILLNNLVQKINIDIKPGSFPNCVNLKSRGLTPVAILGGDNLDIAEIDSSSLRLAGAEVAIKPNGKPQAALEDVNKDGFLDLISHFETNKLLLGENEEFITLTGNLFDGKAIRGMDSICFTKGSFMQRGLEAFSGLLASIFMVSI